MAHATRKPIIGLERCLHLHIDIKVLSKKTWTLYHAKRKVFKVGVCYVSKVTVVPEGRLSTTC